LLPILNKIITVEGWILKDFIYKYGI